ncbi:MAG: dihydroorotate dehydrogenase electron transfer subunit [Polyangiaceae bacterium]
MPDPSSLTLSRTPRRQVTAPLLRRDSMGNAYHVLTFDLPEGMDALPGQFAMVRGAEWGDAPLLPRPMSFLTSGNRPSILIKVFGEGTIRMARAVPGEPFEILGPLGNTWPSVTPGKRPLLVAGGVGVAPLIYFARALHAEGTKPIAIYGGRSHRDLPLNEELADVCELYITTEDGSRGAAGRVTLALPELLNDDVEVFTCGPDRMMAAVAELCAAKGIRCIASLETPMACGYGVCLGCPVKRAGGGYLYACTDGPCIDAKSIDWGEGSHAPRRSERGER